MSNNAHELSNRLLNALDNNYNVVDMHTVNEIISILEKFNITKELLETTRLGKHVNELRRKTTDPTLARRAKVLVKRWRDLVIPTVVSPAHTGSNRSSAERTVRRLGGTPLTSPALSLSRQVVSPAVPSPRPPSRPAWGGYESDSQDVILVDDDPPAPSPLLNAHKPLTPPVKRPPSPQYDEKKAKRDKKPKKRRGHSRAGSGSEAAPGGVTIPAPSPPSPWRDRNGTDRRRNGCRKGALDPYTALVNRMPKVGDKKVKTTKELLEQIQSRGARPASPASPHSPDVMLIEPDSLPIKVDSPLRNGGKSPAGASPARQEAVPLPPLEDEREYWECTCGEEASAACPAARSCEVVPASVAALHHAYLPGVNGTRAPPHPHQYTVRRPADPDHPALFANVVPLYRYSDYADDYCVKNMARVPLCAHLPWTEFAPPPPDPPPPPSPPPPRPYPIDDPPVAEDDAPASEIKTEPDASEPTDDRGADVGNVKIEAEMIGVPNLEPGDRLKAPLLTPDEETQFTKNRVALEAKAKAEDSFETRSPDHRTVERTKESLDGRALFELCKRVADDIPYDYAQMHAAPVLAAGEAADVEERLRAALERAEADTERDALGRPLRPTNFTEWHECARLGELIALPYVVID